MFCNQLSEHAFVAMVVDTKMKKVIEDIDRIEPIVDFIRPFNNTKKIPVSSHLSRDQKFRISFIFKMKILN